MRHLFGKTLRILSLALHSLFGFGECCRFTPSCSQYAEQAINERGIFVGILVTVRRLFRCHPWGPHGFDPVSKGKVLKHGI